MGALFMDRQDYTASNANNKHGVITSNFDVLDAFSRLDMSRKMALFDQLMAHRTNAYKNSIKSFWPQSTEEDARKLELVLRSRMARLQGNV